jgi:hypothetical protein
MDDVGYKLLSKDNIITFDRGNFIVDVPFNGGFTQTFRHLF